METYIKKNIKEYYIDFNEEIDSNYWKGKIGTTYEDFLNNKWIHLNNEQIEFHNNNPLASIKEVLELSLNDNSEQELQRAINRKILLIRERDNSSEVNNFKVNGIIDYWFTASERADFRNSIDAAKLVGKENLSLFIGNLPIEISTEQAERILASIQLYANACFMTTKQHIINVSNLESVEDVNNYDITTGYPEILNFTIN